MLRIKGRYSNQTIQLDQPLNLSENSEIEVEIHVPEDTLTEEWAELGMSRLEQEWDNPGDAVYDNRSSLASGAVEVRGMAEVRSYLDRHPDMFEMVERICKAARREFGPEASLTLQVYRDPEIEDEYLLLRVRLCSYPPDTMQRIRSISNPYDDELGDKSGSIVITSDFGPIG